MMMMMMMMMMMNDADGGGALVWLVLLHCVARVDVLCAPACVGHLLDVRLYDGDLLLLPRMCLLAVRVPRVLPHPALCGSCFVQCRRLGDWKSRLGEWKSFGVRTSFVFVLLRFGSDRRIVCGLAP